MDNLAEQLAETNLNDRSSKSMLTYLRQRELGGKRSIPFRLVPESREKNIYRMGYNVLASEFNKAQQKIQDLKEVRDSYAERMTEDSLPYDIDLANEAIQMTDKELKEQYKILDEVGEQFRFLDPPTVEAPIRLPRDISRTNRIV